MSYWIHLCREEDDNYFCSYRSTFVPLKGDFISIRHFHSEEAVSYLVKGRLIEFVEHSDKSSVVDVTLRVKSNPPKNQK